MGISPLRLNHIDALAVADQIGHAYTIGRTHRSGPEVAGFSSTWALSRRSGRVIMTTKLSRRQVLRLALLSGSGGLLAACTSPFSQPAIQEPSPQLRATPAAANIGAPTTSATAATAA